MIEIPLLDLTWYGACYRFPSGAEAKEAWSMISDLNPDGSWHVGILRHMRVGLDDEAVLVSVVGGLAEGVRSAEEALKALGGEETELHPNTWLLLVKRRVEAVLALDAAGAGSGRHRIQHPEGGDLL